MGDKFGRRRAGSSNEMLKSKVSLLCFSVIGTKEALTVFAKKIRWAVVKVGNPRAKETKR